MGRVFSTGKFDLIRVSQYLINSLKGVCKGLEYSKTPEKTLKLQYWNDVRNPYILTIMRVLLKIAIWMNFEWIKITWNRNLNKIISPEIGLVWSKNKLAWGRTFRIGHSPGSICLTYSRTSVDGISLVKDIEGCQSLWWRNRSRDWGFWIFRSLPASAFRSLPWKCSGSSGRDAGCSSCEGTEERRWSEQSSFAPWPLKFTTTPLCLMARDFEEKDYSC